MSDRKADRGEVDALCEVIKAAQAHTRCGGGMRAEPGPLDHHIRLASKVYRRLKNQLPPEKPVSDHDGTPEER